MKELTYSPRGVGNNCIKCCICGHESGCQPDMAAFVEGKVGGEDVVALFVSEGLTAILDFRLYEPNWVQVKIGACKKHKPFLHKLYDLTYANRKISQRLIAQAKIGIV